jgi:SAM-dependent methyltransferase
MDEQVATGTVPEGTSTTIPGPREDAVGRGIDQDRLDELLGRVVGDLGGAWTAPLVRIGDRLGLFTALSRTHTATPDELAQRTGTAPRYVAEWLLAMAASGYVDHLGDGRYGLSPEQAALFTDEDSPAYVVGGFQLVTAGVRAAARIGEAFRIGAGMGWHEHHPDLFEGTERFFRPGYLANLTSQWIPALTGLEECLRQGAQVADVGCGLGASTLIMAEAYPASSFVGIDYHEASIAAAREKAGAADRIRFEVGPAEGLTGQYDLVTLFDSLHDMPDPLGALHAVRGAQRDDGWVLMVEPMSGDRVEDALNPVGRLYRGGVGLPVPAERAVGGAEGGPGQPSRPGAHAHLAEQAGFTRAREATRTPFNIVYELRP